ncbi:GvpL/GvpF family gas vesicle protein [Kutzneria viridogrisea]|uniref:Gas vesicle synthesis protein GvpL/GvpF n=1 Tax=Kutzneria viridogrisea TaxID=47990 RepID=A0ABR6BEM0_9PSEU|nr:hypothetical protein [Kutzneria viridogrisea]
MVERALRYLYAVSRRVELDWVYGLRGVGGEQPHVVAAGGVTAVVGAVDQAEFGVDALQGALADPVRLEQFARAHHHVVDSLALRTTTVPLRMGTVCEGLAGVLALLTGHPDRFRSLLDRFEDHQEWGVKGYLDADCAETEDAAATYPGRSGTEYLLRRRAAQHRDAQRTDRVIWVSGQVHAELSALAAGERLLRPRGSLMVLNGAYLVRRADVPGLRRVVAGLPQSHRGLRLEVTGPWAPYSFVDEGARP